MLRELSYVAAKAITKVRPEIFALKAKEEARRGMKVTTHDGVVDIARVADRQVIRISRPNAIHLVEMIESFDHYFTSAEAIEMRSDDGVWNIVDFSTPRLHNVLGFDDFSVLCPSQTEPYAITDQYIQFAEFQPGDVVFDLGAYSALTSICFSKAVGPTGIVIALEPDPVNFFAAERNVAAHARVNGLTNIVLSQTAVAATEGVLHLASEGTMGSALTSIVGGHRGKTIPVQCQTMQGIVDANGLTKVDFVKIDIEGAEEDMILASGDFLKRFRPKMIIESHRVKGTSTSGPIVAFLEGLGYDCTLVPQDGMALPLITAKFA